MSSIAAVIAKSAPGVAGKCAPGSGNSNEEGIVFIPVKRGEVLGVSMPAEFVSLVERPNAFVRSKAVASDAPTRS